MAEYTELIKALRCNALSKQCDSCKYGYHLCPDSECNDACNVEQVYADAAAAIEELDAEETRLLLLTSDLQDKLMDLQAAQPHWVSVFDDLPRHNAVVVVSDGKRSWDVGQYHFLFKSDDRTIWWWKKHTTRKVLWWMYKEDALPQPPQEVQDA